MKNIPTILASPHGNNAFYRGNRLARHQRTLLRRTLIETAVFWFLTLFDCVINYRHFSAHDNLIIHAQQMTEKGGRR